MTRNRHIVDELADIRAQKKELEKREDELKAAISEAMGSRDSLGGDQFIALQKVSSRKGAIDTKAMHAAGLNPDDFRKPDVTVYSIVVEPRVMDAA